MENIQNIITFPKSKYPICKDHFTVRDFYGSAHQMITLENLTNEYRPYENIMQNGIINNYLRIVNGDDEHIIHSYQNIIIPVKFSGEVIIGYYECQKFGCPRVLKSIDHNSFCERFDFGKYEAKLTPLQELMFQDIIAIVKEFLDEKDQNRDIRDIFEEGYEILNYALKKCSGAIEMIEKHINGIMFEAMNCLSETYDYKFCLMNSPYSMRIHCV